MAFDTAAWLNELAAGGALSAEELATAGKIFGKDAVVKRLSEGQLRQADYSRQVAEATKKQADAEALIQANTAWKQDADAKFEKLTGDLEAERISKGTYDAKLRKLAADYNLDLSTLLPATDGPPAKTTPEPTYVKREDFDAKFKEVGALAGVGPRIAAKLQDLNNDHLELFGKPMPNASGLMERALKENRTLDEVFQEQFKIPEVRSQKATEAQTAREDQIRRETEARVRSELGVAGVRTGRAGDQSSIFQNIKPPAEGHQEQGRGVAAAVRAFEEGKYQEKDGAAR